MELRKNENEKQNGRRENKSFYILSRCKGMANLTLFSPQSPPPRRFHIGRGEPRQGASVNIHAKGSAQPARVY